jgi:hypothetical protein
MGALAGLVHRHHQQTSDRAQGGCQDDKENFFAAHEGAQVLCNLAGVKEESSSFLKKRTKKPLFLRPRQ